VRVGHTTLYDRTHPPDGTVGWGRLAKRSVHALTSTTMAEQAAKRQKLEVAVEPLIGTHNGTFHCDEALALYLLRKTTTFEHSRK